MGGAKRGAGRATTIIDIARAAGVSKSTVSLVLKGIPLVKAGDPRAGSTRAIEQLGYVYNRGAANLRTARSQLRRHGHQRPDQPVLRRARGRHRGRRSTSSASCRSSPTPTRIVERQARGAALAARARRRRHHHEPGARHRRLERWPDAARAARSRWCSTMRRIAGSPLPYVGPDNLAGAARRRRASDRPRPSPHRLSRRRRHHDDAAGAHRRLSRRPAGGRPALRRRA